MSPTTSASSRSPGLTAAPGKLVGVPRVAESPVSFECKLTQIIQLQGANGEKAQAWLTFGEVVAVHIDKAMIKDGVYQTAARPPHRPRRPEGRLFRNSPGSHVRDGKAGLAFSSPLDALLRGEGRGEGSCRAVRRHEPSAPLSPEPRPHQTVTMPPFARVNFAPFLRELFTCVRHFPLKYPPRRRFMRVSP